jgi:hypothetical protein
MLYPLSSSALHLRLAAFLVRLAGGEEGRGGSDRGSRSGTGGTGKGGSAVNVGRESRRVESAVGIGVIVSLVAGNGVTVSLALGSGRRRWRRLALGLRQGRRKKEYR